MTQNPVIIENYSDIWAQEFKQIQTILRNSLQDTCISIEHVGSTSIQGLSAKPILDIDIVIETRDMLPLIIKKLKILGYTHCGDQGIPGREAFSRDSSQVPYTTPPTPMDRSTCLCV